MNEQLQNLDQGYAAVSAEQRNRVLRNTYWLLALTLVPSVLGAVVGYKTQLFLHMPWMFVLAIFLGGGFAFIYAINKTKQSSIGVYVLLAFTFFEGLTLTPIITMTLWRYSNGVELIAMAFGGTALVFFGVASVSTVIKRDLSSMGKWLFVGIIMLFVALLANLFFQSSALMIALSVIAIGLFSAYLLYDIKQVIDGGETNYITATLSIYLDLINIFVHLLNLLGIFGGDD